MRAPHERGTESINSPGLKDLVANTPLPLPPWCGGRRAEGEDEHRDMDEEAREVGSWAS